MQINLPTVTQSDLDLASRHTKDVPDHLQNMVEHWAELVRQAHPGLSDAEILKSVPTMADQEAAREKEHAAIAELARLERLSQKEQEDEAAAKRAAEQAALDAKAKEQRDADVAAQAQAMLQAALSQLPAHMQAELSKSAAPAVDAAFKLANVSKV